MITKKTFCSSVHTILLDHRWLKELLIPYLAMKHSAGTQATKINPFTIRVLLEIGIDISTYRVKDISEFKNKNFKYVVTVCDHARKTCPFFPNGEIFLHSSFIDPSEAEGTDQEILFVFRNVRDSIREWIQSNFGL